MSEETQDNRVVPVNIEEEMKTAYIDYSMSVIVSRALPDVRDGLKPVHRRILYGMNELGLHANKPHKKSARIVGEVLGKYHPHGDTAVYDAMVRMAQQWSMRYQLVDGQGNFGSVDGDSPAAMRYTEARLQKISADILGDIDKDTVDFRLNFDDSLKEPTVLPSKIPTLLVNGASGIAVGMATNMLPHNLTEVINGTIALIDNREITSKELMEYIKGPDFPTGGIMYGTGGVIQAYETGRGRVVVRAKTEIEEKANGKSQIIVEELPYQVNKAMLIAKTAALVNDKKIEGIAAIDDFSDRNGMRIVYDLKRDANPQVVLNNLFKQTALQTSYGINNICLVNGRPELLPLKDLISHFVDFRHEVVYRRTQFELRKAEERAHILEGLIIAVDNIDEVIKLIRASKNVEEARNGLMSRFELSEIQARAILEMRLQKLTGLEIDKLRAEYDEVMKLIAKLKEILEKEELRMQIIKDELTEIRDKYGDERQTEITFNDGDINIEDIIDDETAAITISHLGYIKRTSLTEYREQGRGGRGSRGAATRNDDFTENLFIASAHNYLLFFTQKGRCYWLRVYQIPEGTKTSKGRAIQNLISLPPDDKVLATIVVKDLNDQEFLENHNIVFCTKKGIVKKTKLKAYSRPRSNGINAIIIREGDELLECKLTDGNSDIILASKAGKAIHFHESKAREMGRNSGGVRGIDIRSNPDDELIGMICLTQEEKESYQVLVVSEKGYGKRTAVVEYRETNRGGKGIKAMNITEKTGSLVAIKAVTSDYGLMIINKSGITIRLAVNTISELSRATQGVKLIRLNEGDEIASVARILEDDDEVENELEDAENTDDSNSTDTEETDSKD